MTRDEIEAAFRRAGLDVPEAETPDILAALPLLEDMTARVRRPREVGAEAAHIFPPPGE